MGVLLLLTFFIHLIGIQPSIADTAAEIDREVDAAVKMLKKEIPKAKELSKVAKITQITPDQ